MKALLGLAVGVIPLLVVVYATGGILDGHSIPELLVYLLFALTVPIGLYFYAKKKETPYFAGGAISAILPNLIIFCLALAVSMFTNY
ncbi:MAG TPA: hypothetical protein VJB56_00205 [Candidatus Paceibacterota bacterium]